MSKGGMMDIEKLTIAEARRHLEDAQQIAALLGREGQAATATGHLLRVTAGELVLTDAAWIADTGRFGEALARGTVSEVEPYPDGEVIVSRGAVLDVSLWHSPLPREVR